MTVKPVLPIKVLLADDSEIMREAIKKLLEDEPRIHIVGEASCFGTAMQSVADFETRYFAARFAPAAKARPARSHR